MKGASSTFLSLKHPSFQSPIFVSLTLFEPLIVEALRIRLRARTTSSSSALVFHFLFSTTICPSHALVFRYFFKNFQSGSPTTMSLKLRTAVYFTHQCRLHSLRLHSFMQHSYSPSALPTHTYSVAEKVSKNAQRLGLFSAQSYPSRNRPSRFMAHHSSLSTPRSKRGLSILPDEMTNY